MGQKARRLNAALEREAATREILRVINSSPDDYEPVFDAILENGTRLCEADLGLLLLRENDGFHTVAHRGTQPQVAAYYRAHPLPLDVNVSVSARCAVECRPIQIRDAADDPIYRTGQEHRRLGVEVEGVRSQLTVPLVRDGEGIGVILVYRREVRAFKDRHVELLSDFAEMAVIALDNVRRFKALNASLERQTATSEILRAISSSPTDYAPVFDTILRSAIRLCRAPFGTLFLVDDGMLRFVAAVAGTRSEFIEYLESNPYPLDDPTTLICRAAREQLPLHIADVREESYGAGEHHRRRTIEAGGVRTLLYVPMLKSGETVGVIALHREEVEPFEEEDIQLVRTFADQAVIALENVRLFNDLGIRNAELNEALERQTATSEILRTISQSPTDDGPVFDAILDNATRLCDAPLAFLMMREGDAFHLVDHRGSRPEFVEFTRANPIPVDSEGTLAGLAARSGLSQQLADITDDDSYRLGKSIHRVASVDLEGIRTALFVPMMKQERCVGLIVLYRREVRAFDDSQVALVSTFADQAVIAVDNVRLFQEIEARTVALTHSLERQTATSEILRAISRSPTDYAPVFQTILDNAIRLCGAPFGFLLLLRDGYLHVVADAGSHPEFIEYIRANPYSMDDPIALVSRAARDRAPLHLEDLRATDYHAGNTVRATSVELGGIRTAVCVPMLKGEEVVGVMALYRQEVKPFNDADIELVTTFADQGVIAIENVRLFQEIQARTAALTQSLERQTATSEILRSISQSPTDYQPVFETILNNATRLCGAPFGTLFLLRGEKLRFVASDAGTSSKFQTFLRDNPLPLDHPRLLVPRAARERVPIQSEDLAADADSAHDPERSAALEAGGIRTLLAVPMLKGDQTLGVIALYRQTVDPFADEDMELVRTFANQAVIAIENVRSFQQVQARTAELTDSLERQTATSEILRAISRSPTNYQPVFDVILENALRLCNAPLGLLLLRRDRHLHLSASRGESQEFLDWLKAHPFPLDRKHGISARAANEQVPVQSTDLADEPRAGDPWRATGVEKEGIRTLLAVPMLKGDETVGVIGLYRREVLPFARHDIETVRTFADQAVIAIENVRLFQTVESRSRELSQSVAELEALGDVAQAVSSTLDLDTVLATIINRAVELSGATAGAIHELDAASGTLPPRAAPGFEAVLEQPAPRLGEGAVGNAAATRAPVQIPDIEVPGAYTGGLRDFLSSRRIRALLAVPMVQDDDVIGTLVVARDAPGRFPEETVRLLRALGTQSAIAIRNARLFREIEDKSRELEAANRHKSEFLANMSHELRTPLNAVIGFSEVLGERMFGDLNDKQAEYVHDIHDSGRHLLSLINDILDLSKIEAGAMELDVSRFALAPALENAATLVKERAGRRGISLQEDLDGDLGEMEGDERKLKQILLNLLSNAIKFTAEGGSVTLEASQRDGRVEIAVRDTGVGISKEDQDVIFEEFRQVGTDYARKVEGTGLGLALTKRFIEMHGGTISVESEPGVGSTFHVSLPLRPREVAA